MIEMTTIAWVGIALLAAGLALFTLAGLGGRTADSHGTENTSSQRTLFTLALVATVAGIPVTVIGLVLGMIASRT